MADASPVVFGIFKALKNKVNKAFRVPPKTKSSDLKRPEKFKPAEVPKQTYGNKSQQATSTANRQKIIDANKAGSKAMDEANAARRASNRTLVEGTNASRTQGIRNRVVAGTAGTGGVATAAYLMSGDATITPKAKPSTPTSSPARTPVADAPTQKIVPWRDRASIAKASSTPSQDSTSSSKKSMSRKGSGVSIPNVRHSDVRGAFRKAGKGRKTAMQATKSRYLAGQAKRESKGASNVPKQTQSIAKPAEITKRYELSAQQAGDKLLQTASNLFPKSSPTTAKVTSKPVAPKTGDARYTDKQRETLSRLDNVSPGLAKRKRAQLDALLKRAGK